MLNKIQFIGHLGRDAELRYLPSGTAVCNFSVASSERWKDKETGEQVERTEWLRCNAFDKLAEICGEWLKKGSLVFVEGSLQTRKYNDKDGNEQTSVECKLTTMKMLGGKPEGAAAGVGRGEQQQERQPAQRQQEQQSRQQAAPARRAPASRPQQDARPATGFDDMDDDIPF